MTAHTDPPDHAADGDDEQLPCGRLLSQVWESWETGADDPHLRSCPHCRQAVAELEELESVVRALPEEPVERYKDELTSLTQRVMDVVRLELRPGRPLPLGEPAEDLWIMESVAARSLRAAAESVPGVRAGSCRLLPRPDGAPALAPGVFEVTSPDAVGPVAVRLDIHAPADASLPDLAERVRLRVLETADRQLGMDIVAVDIRITDLLEPAADNADNADNREGRDR
ncbi:Asp23/Gls24 family envelope stress response protein [Streptomyces griseoviridis]|uniref:Asp23/Gls24 family envelope stress response protein n=1 Tax=Streptomyces griseoviridis TaxID=45398 RepID=UPI0033CF5D09